MTSSDDYNIKMIICTKEEEYNLREGAEQKVVFITGRVHPGETPSSFVCQGELPDLMGIPCLPPTPNLDTVMASGMKSGHAEWIDSVLFCELSINVCSLAEPSSAFPPPSQVALCAHLTPQLDQHVPIYLSCFSLNIFPFPTPSAKPNKSRIIDFLISQHPVARVLREHLVFKIAPMLNPDGVYLGNYRCSLMGFDLNRHWLDPSPWAHPTLHGVKQLIIQMYNDPKTSLEFYIDIHAHSTMMNGFMYGNIFEDEERFQRQAVFPKLLCQNAEDFSYSSTSFNRDAVKAGTGRRFLGGLLDHTSYCYTLEVSFYSYIIGGTTAAVPYTEEACILGRSPTPTSQPASSQAYPAPRGFTRHIRNLISRTADAVFEETSHVVEELMVAEMYLTDAIIPS
ncbi:hypothetical protein CB1_000365002 [Camelus ferus]|nr:hypothetical protein CB1_000365002 [Camelus ferus]